MPTIYKYKITPKYFNILLFKRFFLCIFAAEFKFKNNMVKLKKTTYSLKDVTVVQAPISYQEHRGDVNPYVETCSRETLPIFVAPMAAVTDENNYKVWIDNKITPVIPRSIQGNVSLMGRLNLSKETFVSFSLQEVKDLVNDGFLDSVVGDEHTLYICIDIAHGTLASLYDTCTKIKKTYGNKIIIMTGNIANPKAYEYYCRCGISYVRVSIGSGSRCTTAANVSIHYGMATLLDDINEVRSNMYRPTIEENSIFVETKVIADGGIGWFDDMQKAIALGADYVMIGKMFAECEEACGEIIWANSLEAIAQGNYYSNRNREQLVENVDKMGDMFFCSISNELNDLKPFRNYYGMSTRISQKITGGDGKKTSEGISRPVEVKYPVSKFLSNVESYLRSCMTYTNSYTIEDLQKNAEVVILGGSGDSSYRK
jgi:hypothetical protein